MAYRDGSGESVDEPDEIDGEEAEVDSDEFQHGVRPDRFVGGDDDGAAWLNAFANPNAPVAKFAEPSAASEVAIAGRDGQRAADLLAASKRAGTDLLASLTERAVRRLLAMPNPQAAPVLFDDDELKQLQASLAGTIATADLLGRSRVRQFAARHVEAEKAKSLASFTEPPNSADFLPLLADALSATPSQHGDARLIGRVFEAVKAKLPDLTRAEFDRQLIAAHRSGVITLSRIDMPQGIDPADIRQSQVNHLNAEFHLIEPGRRVGWRTGVPAVPAATPPMPVSPAPPTAGTTPTEPPATGLPASLPGRLGPDDDPFAPFPEPIPFQQPKEAVEYFNRLIPSIGTDPYRYGALLERHAFTLAAAADQALLDKVKQAIVKKVQGVVADRLSGAATLGTATADIQDILDAAGVAPANPQYSEMIFRTNMMDAYNAGQTAEMAKPEMQEFFPVWRYEGILDSRTGDDHRPKIDKYFPSTAVFADVRGPRVWNCRCGHTPLYRTEWAELQAKGARVESSW